MCGYVSLPGRNGFIEISFNITFFKKPYSSISKTFVENILQKTKPYYGRKEKPQKHK
jgi:hypothetical protein